MTDLRTIPPGPELDAEVATALGYLIVHCDDGPNWGERQCTRFPCYVIHKQGGRYVMLSLLRESTHGCSWSTVDADAVQLLAEVVNRGWHYELMSQFDGTISACVNVDEYAADGDIDVIEPTFAAAVSRAFVLAADAVTRGV